MEDIKTIKPISIRVVTKCINGFYGGSFIRDQMIETVMNDKIDLHFILQHPYANSRGIIRDDMDFKEPPPLIKNNKRKMSYFTMVGMI